MSRGPIMSESPERVDRRSSRNFDRPHPITRGPVENCYSGPKPVGASYQDWSPAVKRSINDVLDNRTHWCRHRGRAHRLPNQRLVGRRHRPLPTRRPNGPTPASGTHRRDCHDGPTRHRSRHRYASQGESSPCPTHSTPSESNSPVAGSACAS